jgi:hypothetical protein
VRVCSEKVLGPGPVNRSVTCRTERSGTCQIRRRTLMGWDKIRRCNTCGAGCPEHSGTCVRCGSADLGTPQAPWRPTDRKTLTYLYRPVPYPPCPFGGSVRPLLSGHLGTKFLEPEKCLACILNFEGDCMRAASPWPPTPQDLDTMPEWVFPVVDFDFGPCHVPSTGRLAEAGPERRRIPEKCASCGLFSTELHCHRYFDWSELPCSLDYSGVDPALLRSLVDQP